MSLKMLYKCCQIMYKQKHKYMGLFDFLKRKELEEIKLLQEKLEQYSLISNVELEIEKKRQELEDLILFKSKEMDLLIENKIQEIAKKEVELQNLIVAKEAELNSTIDNKVKAVKNIQDELDKFNLDYQSALELYTKLRKDISLFEPKLNLIEFGIYDPVYDFEV